MTATQSRLSCDPAAVADAIRRAAAAEILPRFRRLQDHHVYEKRPGELVTEADIAAERALSDALLALEPAAVVVGEEGYEASPETLGHISEDRPVWVVDPVDGTQNFADGRDCFAVLVALQAERRTVAGWLYDPVRDRMVHTRKGEGAWLDGVPLAPVRAGGKDLSALTGSVNRRFTRLLGGTPGGPRCVSRYRCVGQEYMDLASGRLDFLQYGGRLKPWDHAAGTLCAAELGYTVALIETGEPYRASDGIVPGTILIAPSAETWNQLRDLFVA